MLLSRVVPDKSYVKNQATDSVCRTSSFCFRWIPSGLAVYLNLLILKWFGLLKLLNFYVV